MAGTGAKKGAKKGRRFDRPRSASAISACKRRKEARIKEQNARAAANRSTVAAGGMTPWQKARAERAAKRVKLQGKAA